MFKKTALLILSMLLLSSGCQRKFDFEKDKDKLLLVSIREPIPADTLIKLERTECYGTCPVYTLTITANGTVVYEGRRFVKSEGRVESKISPEQLSEILAAVRRADYFSMKDRYALVEDGCDGIWTDLSSAITTIRINGRTKTIRHYYGCQDKPNDGISLRVYPRDLYELENKIDEIVGSEKWVKIDQR